MYRMGFNSRPHARGDKVEIQWKNLHRVSIHAPTQGATWNAKGEECTEWVSIHAPMQGATIIFVCDDLNACAFQFTPHARGDFHRWNAVAVVKVSIHAPMQGATARYSCAYRRHYCFNSRPHARGDCNKVSYTTILFNVSIHAPTQGATQTLY